jgi:hypothetical protein
MRRANPRGMARRAAHPRRMTTNLRNCQRHNILSVKHTVTVLTSGPGLLYKLLYLLVMRCVCPDT